MSEDNCSKGFISIILIYIVAFVYVFDKNVQYYGYIMLIIAYLFSTGYLFNFYDTILINIQPIFNIISKDYFRYIFILCAFCIIFFNIYSLIKILNAYSFKSTKNGSFNLKLNERHKRELTIFNNSFIVGNLSWFFFIYSLIGTETRIGYSLFDKTYNEKINTEKGNNLPSIYKLIFFVISFVCVWIEMAFAIDFAKIKNE